MQCVCTLLLSVACLALKYFSTLSHKWQIFEMKLLNVKFVFWFSAQILFRNISHSNKSWVRYDQKWISVFTYSTRHSCHILTKLELSWQIFEKYSNTEFRKIPCSASRVFPYGWTDLMKPVVALHNFMDVLSLRNSDQWMVRGQQRCFVYCADRPNMQTVHSVNVRSVEWDWLLLALYTTTLKL
jgi:hypothetical protein